MLKNEVRFSDLGGDGVKMATAIRCPAVIGGRRMGESAHDEVGSRTPHGCVGYGEASWWSPQSKDIHAPYADQIAMRHLPDKDLPLLEHCWMSVFAGPQLLPRQVSKPQWYFAGKDIHQTCICGQRNTLPSTERHTTPQKQYRTNPSAH